ncbi:MAG: hypothetical protein AB8G96_09570 [Phycisphaerales bacterium]
MGRWLRRLMISLALTVVIAIIALVLLRRALGPPQWYAPPKGAEAEALAEKVEYSVVEVLHRVREPGEPWSVRVTDAEANAWLSERLPEWARQQGADAWPAALRPPQVQCAGEQLTVAMVAGRGPVNVSATAVLGLAGPKIVDVPELTVVSVDVGRGPFGASALKELAAITGDDAAAEVADDPAAWLNRRLQDWLDAGAYLRLVDGREVGLRDVRFDEGAMVLTFVTR